MHSSDLCLRVCYQVMPSVHEEVMRLGGSSFLTEFGLCAPNGDEQSIDTVECEFVMREADEYLQSWTYWDSEFFNDSLHGDSPLSSVYNAADKDMNSLHTHPYNGYFHVNLFPSLQ